MTWANGGPAGSTTKAGWRTAMLTARSAVSPARRAADARALGAHLRAAVGAGETVCAYVPVGSEPGSRDVLDALTSAHVRVLLPVARSRDGQPLPLCWGEYRRGQLVPAPFGLLEPAGEPLPSEAIAIASVVVVPALAVDRSGARLGRGAGFYDRSLHLADPDARLVAMVRDDELVAELPCEAHDVPMTHALTPERALITLDQTIQRGAGPPREWPEPPGGSST